MSRYFLLFVVLLVLPTQLALAQTVFSRDLQQGSFGEDVRKLQQFLNQDQTTQISAFGLCSPGQETGYFNTITRIAVIKFQEKYASEILAPIGLKVGTGYVGALTRKKLNSFMNQSAFLSAGNTFGTENSVVLPAKTTITPSFTTTNPTPVISRPVITKIDPAEAENGDTINIYGSGFTATGNTVITTFGSFEGLTSADGKKLTFKFVSEVIGSMIDINTGVDDDRVEDLFEDMQVIKMAPLPVVIMVRNAGGFSNATTSFRVIIQ